MSKDAINSNLRLYQDTYNDEGYSSVNHMSKALLYQSEMLSPIVTHLYYTSEQFGSRNFPITFLTEGMGNTRSIKSIDYTQGIMGKPKKTSTVAVKSYVNDTDTPGKGFAPFVITFADRWFHKSLVIMSSDKTVQARVIKEPERNGKYWDYTCVIASASSQASIPLKHLEAGQRWARLIPKVGIERSKGVEHRSYAPGKMTNQLSLVRDTYKIAGNVENKVMVVEIKAGNKTHKFWTEWELYLRQLEWKEKCESDLWYSLYNKDENGEIHDRDEDSGEVVPSGSGILEQIPNEDTYSFLTTEKLTQIIRDVFFGTSDATKRTIDVFTGTGGMEEANNAMASAAKGFTLVDSKFVDGQGHDLVYGAYFKTFRHIDGHTINFRLLPMMDTGVAAEASEKHPISGLPLESYNMYFIDTSTYDGQSNLLYVSEKGRENIEFIVAGATTPKGYSEIKYRASDVDASSVQWMKSQGVIIRRPTNCFKLMNTLN
jgi:hypothetical protein